MGGSCGYPAVAVAVVGIGLRPGGAAAGLPGRLQPVQRVVGIDLVLIQRRPHADPLAQDVAVVRAGAVGVVEQQEARRGSRPGCRQAARGLGCPQADLGRLQAGVVAPLLPEAVAQKQLLHPSVGLIVHRVRPRPAGIPAVDARLHPRNPPRPVIDVVHHPVGGVPLRGQVPRTVVGVGHGVGGPPGGLGALQHPPQGVVAVVGRPGDFGG